VPAMEQSVGIIFGEINNTRKIIYKIKILPALRAEK
jgi:hypothetical protein